MLLGIGVILLGVIGAGGYLAYNHFRDTSQVLTEPSIKTYGECAIAANSQLEGAYSEICIDSEGRQHFQEVESDFSPAPLAECPDRWGSETITETNAQAEFIYYGDNKVPVNESIRDWVIQNCVVRPQS